MNFSNFYVYEHWRPDRGECFYVGKGIGRRANMMKGRNLHHTAIQNKLSKLGLFVEVRLVASGLTEQEAFKIESERIAMWRADGADLANMTTGGEGASGRILSAESRAKISAANKGRILPEETRVKIAAASTGRKCTLEAKAKISAANKGRPGRKPSQVQIEALVSSNKRRKGKPLSDEHRAKLCAARAKRVISDETKAKTSASIKGRKLTDEHRSKISAAHKRRHSAKIIGKTPV